MREKSDFILKLFAFSIPFSAFGIINTGDFGIDITLLLAILLVGKYVVDTLVLGRQIVADNIDKLILLFLGVAFFSEIIAVLSGPVDVYRMFKQIVLLAVYCILFLYLKSYLGRNLRSLLTCLRYYLFSACFVMGFGLYQFLSGIFNLPYPHLFLRSFYNASIAGERSLLIYRPGPDGFARIESIFYEPGALALFLLGCIPLFYCIASINVKFPFRKQLLNKTMFPLSIFIMMMTLSLAGYVGLCITVVIVVLSQAGARKIFKKLNLKIAKSIVLIFAIIAIVGVFLTSNKFMFRVHKIPVLKAQNFIQAIGKKAWRKEGKSTIAVLQTLTITSRIIRARPFLGTGYGNFKSYFDIYAPYWALRNVNNIGGTSVFWRILSETGIIGAVVFLWFFIVLLKKCHRVSKNVDKANLYLLLEGVWLSLVCFGINFLFIRSGGINQLQFWFLLALGGAISSLKLEKGEENEIRDYER
ncbi:O-antigen ligase family protein [Candidatus Omnitrophota bacterium]